MEKIKVQEFKLTPESLRLILSHVEMIPKEQILSDDIYKLMYYVLDIFDWTAGTLKLNEPESIKNTCVVILNTLGINEVSSEHLWHSPDPVNRDRSYDPVKHCIEALTQFRMLPLTCYIYLDTHAKQHLKAVLALIKDYEQDENVQLLLAGKSRGKHEFRVRTDFFKRCTRLRDKITEYIVDGMYRRALHKAKVSTAIRQPTMLSNLRAVMAGSDPGSLSYFHSQNEIDSS